MTNKLEVRDLCVEVDGKKLLKHLDLTVPKGEVHALMGMNGSGKTSLMMAIMGFPQYKVTSGSILFEGKDITNMSLMERSRLGIGIAVQRPPVIPGVDLEAILTYMDGGRLSKRGMDFVKFANMEKYLNRDLYKGFSGGEIKRAELLQLLVQAPGFSMMDEPDSGVDIESLKQIGQMINTLFSEKSEGEKASSGLIVTHYGNILEYIDVQKAHIMMNGQIACSGEPKKMLETVKNNGYEACVLCMEKGK